MIIQFLLPRLSNIVWDLRVICMSLHLAAEYFEESQFSTLPRECLKFSINDNDDETEAAEIVSSQRIASAAAMTGEDFQ